MSEENRDYKSEIAVLQQNLEDHRELLDQVRTLPEHRALEIVRSLQSVSDPAAVLASLHGSMSTRYVIS